MLFKREEKASTVSNLSAATKKISGITVKKKKNLRVTGSPRRGHSEAEDLEKRSRPVIDPLVGEGA